MERLSRAALARVPASARPLIVPGECPTGIVHLGVGAFHRAHQAVYTERAIATSGGEWAIAGVSPRSRSVADVLESQDCLYSVTAVDGDDSETRVIGSVNDVIPAPDDIERVVGLLAAPAIRVVTLTVTEKGYRLNGSGGFVDDQRLWAELRGDLPPSSVPSMLVRGLAARARQDAGPLAVVSCDNLSENGTRLRTAVHDAFDRIAADRAWLDANVTFPCTMVDRIVPASTDETRNAAAAALGVIDRAAVRGEKYSEWVIEDDFPGGRPDWSVAGATLTADVTPYGRRKLRVLNGMHSMLALLGLLAGRATISDAVRLPGMEALLERFVSDEVAPTLKSPDGVAAVDYARSCIDRFANPAISYGTRQVVADSSQKLAQRIVPVISDRRAMGTMPRWAALAVAAWMRLATSIADDDAAIPHDDASADLDDIFPGELAGDSELRSCIADWVTGLERHGATVVVASAAGRE